MSYTDSIASLLTLASVCAATTAALAQEVIVHPASNTDPEPGPAGEPPYEMEGRLEERVPLVSFEDVSGWEVEGVAAEGWLYRTQEQRIYRDHSAKLVYVGRGEQPVLTVRPQTPIPIPDPWDCVNFWNYGNNWGWAPDPNTPPLRASVVIRDAAGTEHEIGLGNMDYQYWFMMNGRLHQAELDRLQRPMELVGFRFRNARNAERRVIYLGPCTFYEEVLGPLTFEPWPDKLPFSTREDTILPTNKTTDYENSVREDGPATVFAYRGDDCELAFRYAPRTGTLGDIELLHQGGVTRRLAGGGPQFAENELEGTPELVRCEREGDVLVARWRYAAGEGVEVEYRFQLKQKSLIIDMACDVPVIERLDLGRAEGIGSAKLIRIPYLTYGYGATDPHALLADGLFTFAQFDHHVSSASVLYGRTEVGDSFAAFGGGARYTPRTDGTRNALRERLFLTVSPDFQEILPNIPNPPSPFREDQGKRLWRIKHDANHAEEIAEARMLRSYGCEEITIRYHEDSWRDAGESFTFRTQAAPKAGGDAALRDMVAAVQSLGWRVGLYTNYTDYAPVNAHWNEDWVSRTPNGDWQRAWMRCYAPKPMIAVEMEAKLAPQIQAKFGENHSYCDVHTAVSPFDRVDYDHRVPGAGTFRQVFECFGRLLYNEKSAHNGPVYSEGLNHWWYAGLTDGNYAQLVSGAPPSEPLLVDFDLLKMHPLEMDAGMGAPGMFFRGAPYDLDQFIATTMVYGHIGMLDWSNLHGMLRIYYMMQPLQAHYSMIEVERIEYEHEGKMVDTSTALATDAYRDGRVHVAYTNGTHVWANGSQEPWRVPSPEGEVELPPWGYLGHSPDAKVLTRSGMAFAGGSSASVGPRRRVDVCRSPNQLYLDSRGPFVFAGPLAGEGAFAVKREADGWVLIPAPEAADAAFDPEVCGIARGQSVVLTALDENGAQIGTPELRWARGLVHLIAGVEGARSYRIRASATPRPAQVGCDTTLAVLGDEVTITPPGEVGTDAIEWVSDGAALPAEARAEGRRIVCRVPADLLPEQHVWLRVGEWWLDFVVAEPIVLSLTATPAHLAPGEPLEVGITGRSALARDVAVEVELSAEGAEIKAQRTVLEVPALGNGMERAQMALPWADADLQLRASATVGGVPVECVAAATVRVSRRAVLDLLDPSVAFARGHRLRGQDEAIGLGSTEQGTFERTRGVAGGEEKACFFTHPPYNRGTGYVFGLFEVTLPDEPTDLVWLMGMRDGLDATDGVTFRVTVIDEADEEAELFTQHHAECRWQEARADLTAYAGRTIRLKLIADSGPREDTTADHALWADLRIVTREEALQVTR